MNKSHTIPAGLPSIGRGTISALHSAGILTAWDVYAAGPDGHQSVVGVGPSKWEILYAWSISALTPDERSDIAQELMSPKASMWAELGSLTYEDENGVFRSVGAWIFQGMTPSAAEKLLSELCKHHATEDLKRERGIRVSNGLSFGYHGAAAFVGLLPILRAAFGGGQSPDLSKQEWPFSAYFLLAIGLWLVAYVVLFLPYIAFVRSLVDRSLWQPAEANVAQLGASYAQRLLEAWSSSDDE